MSGNNELLPGVTQFLVSGGESYDGIKETSRRRPPKIRTLSEDRHLKGKSRRKMMATTRDIRRNFAICQWMVKKHIDFVTQFSFQGMTDDHGWNREFEAFIKEKSKKENFDLAQRHNRARALRICEGLAVVDGDYGWLKQIGLRYRGRIEMVEGDLICMPDSVGRNRKEENWENGVQIDQRTGRALRYAICVQHGDSKDPELSRTVAARSMIMRGYYTRIRQVRGVSPLAAAMNPLRDVYDASDYALAKIKMAQLMGLKVTRSADGSLAEYVVGGLRQEADYYDSLSDEEKEKYDKENQGKDEYSVDLGDGPFALDMDRGDDAEILESKTPSSETTRFLEITTHVAIKALDLPYSFYDEAHTNFYGSRGGLLQYLKSCKDKREDNELQLDAWTRWRTGISVADGELELPRGKDFSWIRWNWVHDGMPWFDPSKEINAQLQGVGAAFTNPQRVCQEIGTNFLDNLDKIAEALEEAEKRGIKLNFSAQPIVAAAANDARKEVDDDDSEDN